MKRIAITVLLGSCAFFGGSVAVSVLPRFPFSTAAQPDLMLASSGDYKLGDRFETVARQVGPAVVYVEASKPGARAAESGGKARIIEESGSGVIVRDPERAGYFVLTNNHVIAQARADQITINLADGRILHPAQVWTDPESDVAVMKLQTAEQIPVANLGNSDHARVGQWVLAIGSPFGLNQTVTHGIISARERGQVSLGSTIRIKDFLQTDAAINPGSSGGPLINMESEIIGINTAIASQSGSNSGVAFSIPINLVKRIMQQLLESGRVSRGYLGMQLAPAFEPADALKLGLDRVQGALVETVYADTPAAVAGLRTNDVVVEIDGAPVHNENHLINSISAFPAGKKVQIRVWRNRKMMAMEAVIGDWSSAQGRFRGGQ